MLKHNEVNPLHVFRLRRVEHSPPHFAKVMFDLNTSEKTIVDWIYENLTGRFYIGDYYINGDIQKIASFEIAGEASYFSLILDTINHYEVS